jgi:putative DNA primase/helicase
MTADKPFADLAEAAPIYDALPPEPARLKAMTAAELLRRDLPPRGMVLHPVIPERGLAMVYAPRGIGKTYFSLGVAYAVASGGSFLRYSAPKPRRVLIVDGEIPLQTLQARFAQTAAGSDAQPHADEYLRIVAADDHDSDFPDLATTEGQTALAPFVADADLIILDNLSTLARSGKENEAEGWTPIQSWLLALRRAGKAVLIVHHSGKGGDQRGTSKREDILDTVIKLTRPEGYAATDGARFMVELTKARGIAGDDAQSFEAKLEIRDGLETRDGAAIWTTASATAARDMMAAELFREGQSVRDVAEELNMSKSAAQRLKDRLGREGKLQAERPGPNRSFHETD